MNPEERELLQRAVRLSEENNKMLRKMRRSAFWGGVLRTVYWLVILAISFGAYVYAKPYLDNLAGVYSGIQTNLGQVEAFKETFRK